MSAWPVIVLTGQRSLRMNPAVAAGREGRQAPADMTMIYTHQPNPPTRSADH
jgi:hypothetical protein